MNGNRSEDAGAELALSIGAVAPDDWSLLVGADPDADYFHTRAWTEAVDRTADDRSALWLTARAGARLVGGLAVIRTPVRRGSLSGELLESSLEGTSGGPVVARDLPVDFAASLFWLLVDRFHQMRSGPLDSLSLSLNSGHEARFGGLLADDGRWTRHVHPAAVVPLDGGIEEVERMRVKKTKRNERNRALRRGVEVEVTRDPRAVAEYYPIYLAAAARWGVRPAPLELLQQLLSAPAEGPGCGEAFFTCVRHEGKVIGGHLNLHYGDRVIAWNGVTDPAHAREHFPATSAIWGDLVESCERGARWLDLGGSGGVVRLDDFKRSFGAEEQERGWYTSDAPLLGLLRAVRGSLRRLTGGRR